MTDLADLKARFNLVDGWRSLDLPDPPTRLEGVYRSPFREDRNPSFSIYDGGRRYKDFATGETGDVLSFIMKAKGCEFPQAKDYIEKALNIYRPTTRPVRSAPRAAKAEKTGASNRAVRLPQDFRPGTPADLEALAELRGWHSEDAIRGLQAASAAGCLGFGTMRDKTADGEGWEPAAAWLVLDPTGRNMSARRMDGEPWECLADRPKTRSLKGSEKTWPVGLTLAAPGARLLVAEGEPDLLALWILSSGRADLAPVGILGAGIKSFPGETSEYIKGRSVTLFPHNDIAGRGAVLDWAREFYRLGAIEVGQVRLDPFLNEWGKDLADALELAGRQVRPPVPEGLCGKCWSVNVAANIGGSTCPHTPKIVNRWTGREFEPVTVVSGEGGYS